jgi:hypothetical protein
MTTYLINVSHHGHYFFRVEKIDEAEAKDVANTILNKFPAGEGYKVTLALMTDSKEYIDLEKFIK